MFWENLLSQLLVIYREFWQKLSTKPKPFRSSSSLGIVSVPGAFKFNPGSDDHSSFFYRRKSYSRTLDDLQMLSQEFSATSSGHALCWSSRLAWLGSPCSLLGHGTVSPGNFKPHRFVSIFVSFLTLRALKLPGSSCVLQVLFSWSFMHAVCPPSQDFRRFCSTSAGKSTSGRSL